MAQRGARPSRRSVLSALGIGAGFMTLSGCGALGADGAEFSITAGHATSTDHFHHRSFLKFKELVEERSSGRIAVSVYPNEVFGGDRELIEAVQLGNLELAAPSSSPLAAFAPEMNVWDLPYLFDDRDHAYRVLDGEYGTRLLDDLTRFRIKGLGYWENGFRNLTTSGRTIESPEDLRGLSLRTLENAVQMRAWNATGANPTPMAFGEVYIGLQQGTIDAQENPLPLIESQRFYEVQRELVISEHVYTPTPLILSSTFFDQLPADLQDVVEQAGADSVTYCREQAVVDNERARETIESAGVNVSELDEETRGELGALMQEAAEPFVRSIVGDASVDELLETVEAER
ncbi:TRAP transporter substrate-binding protein [Sediminivirga luteola]|uniref:TRAP transporter substrate-binding protein n=1 Tax=Sediminivirga luteola TaxID=1774748 RepID=UPI001F5706CA|nr:TRAP transporter substrate-binding protein [Sediminivirga luteola]